MTVKTRHNEGCLDVAGRIMNVMLLGEERERKRRTGVMRSFKE